MGEGSLGLACPTDVNTQHLQTDGNNTIYTYSRREVDEISRERTRSLNPKSSATTKMMCGRVGDGVGGFSSVPRVIHAAKSATAAAMMLREIRWPIFAPLRSRSLCVPPRPSRSLGVSLLVVAHDDI